MIYLLNVISVIMSLNNYVFMYKIEKLPYTTLLGKKIYIYIYLINTLICIENVRGKWLETNDEITE